MKRQLLITSIMFCTFLFGQDQMMPAKDGGKTMKKAEWLEMQPNINRPDGVPILSVTRLDQSEQSRDMVLSEDFEGGAVPPTDWTLDNGAAGVGWEISTNPNGGTYSAFCDYYQSDVTTLLLSPAIDLSGETVATLTFYEYGVWGSYYHYHDVSVYVGGTLVGFVETEAATDYTWEQFAVDISDVAAGFEDVQVGFYYAG